ncbi:MAG: helix-turn-helix domain-containing protein [Clostridia bacterium]|nr:helix-turn-helix domain-containing protein [Clostridia bacterium]
MDIAFGKAEKYMGYLRNECGLHITVHDAGKGFIADNIVSISPYNVHSNGYCLYAKTKEEVWDKCIYNQKKVVEKLRRDGAFFGMCYMGVEEYVFPIKVGEDVVGFVSVSGYGINRERAYAKITRAASEFGLDKYELLRKYDEELSHDKPSDEFISTVIEPLCSMLSLIYITFGSKLEHGARAGGDNYVYGHILSYINRNYNKKITVDDLCALCHCSRSHISHLFTKKAGMGICEYINRKRCDNAARLLTDTDERIQEIAYLVGFDDSNYFTNVFTKYMGASPREYRSREKSASET